VHISKIPLLPPTFKSSRMTSQQYSQTILKFDTFCMDIALQENGALINSRLTNLS